MADRLLQPFLPSKPFRNGTVATSSVVTKQALIHLIYLTTVGGGDEEGDDAQAHARRNLARGELNRWTAGVN